MTQQPSYGKKPPSDPPLTPGQRLGTAIRDGDTNAGSVVKALMGIACWITGDRGAEDVCEGVRNPPLAPQPKKSPRQR